MSIVVKGDWIVVPPDLEQAVLRAHRASASMPTEMTTTRATEFLGVSRAFIIKLIKRGELPCCLLGSRRRIPTGALVVQRDKMTRQAHAAADEMARLSQEAGLYDLEVPLSKDK